MPIIKEFTQPPIETSQYLVLSTRHITQADDAALEAHAELAGDAYGHWVPVDFMQRYRDDDMSVSFEECLAFARFVDCTYIKFDRDGPDVEGLDTHDW